jgi:hypothetical protein
MHIYIHIHTYKNKYIHTCTHAHIHSYTHTHIQQGTGSHVARGSACFGYIMLTHTHTHTYIHTYMHAYIHHIHTYIHTHIHTYNRAREAMSREGVPVLDTFMLTSSRPWVHTHMNRHMHTHINTCMYTFMLIPSRSWVYAPHTCTDTCMHLCLQDLCLHKTIFSAFSVYLSTHVYIHTYTHREATADGYQHNEFGDPSAVNIDICIHTYIHTYVHTYPQRSHSRWLPLILTYIHTYIPTEKPQLMVTTITNLEIQVQ